MSSNLDTGKAADDEAKVLGSSEQAGSLIDHLNCSSATALQNLLARCNRDGRRIMPSRPMKLPAKPAKRVDYFLTLAGADKIIEHSLADQVISVEAGISISALQMLLAQNKQWFPVCVPDDSVSLMEYINSGSSGPLEYGYGEARDLVLGMQVALGSGELINCGGKVVKNVTGYDLPKLFTGAHGTLCIPYSAHLRLFALPETESTLLYVFDNIESAFAASSLLRRSGLPISCLEIADSDLFAGTQPPTPSPGARTSRPLQLPQELENLKNKVITCIQLHGITSVVAELEKELNDLIAPKSIKQAKLNPTQAQDLWRLLARPSSATQAAWIELAAPTKVLAKLLSSVKSNNPNLTWTARPGRNKAVILAPELEDADNLLSKLTSSITDGANAITVAYADANYLWKIRNLPSNDPVLDELKHRLKAQYDPAGILNPLASI